MCFNTYVEVQSVSDFLLLTHGFWGPDLSCLPPEHFGTFNIKLLLLGQ